MGFNKVINYREVPREIPCWFSGHWRRIGSSWFYQIIKPVNTLEYKLNSTTQRRLIHHMISQLPLITISSDTIPINSVVVIHHFLISNLHQMRQILNSYHNNHHKSYPNNYLMINHQFSTHSNRYFQYQCTPHSLQAHIYNLLLRYTTLKVKYIMLYTTLVWVFRDTARGLT